jgi:hypothetical protein
MERIWPTANFNYFYFVTDDETHKRTGIVVIRLNLANCTRYNYSYNIVIVIIIATYT